MEETFTIIYQGNAVNVAVNYAGGDSVFTIQLPQKHLSIEMNVEGYWQEVEGEHTPQAQELGELIQNHDNHVI